MCLHSLEYRTSIAEVMGSNPLAALLFFFRLLLFNCLNWKIYCNDDSSLSFINATKMQLKNEMTTAIKSLQKQSYYEELFEYYFDLLSPNQFDLRDSEGAVIEKNQLKTHKQ